MSDKFFVGLDITSFENNGRRKPISRITLWLDDNNYLTAGDDTGSELEADCPHATQTMVNNLLAQVKGYQYQAYSAGAANIDPAAELGDGVTVSGVYSVISRIEDDGSGYLGLSSPGEQELEDEYPAAGPMTQEFNRQISITRSLITKTAEEIRLEVENEVEGLSSAIEVDLTEISGRVMDAEGSISVVLNTLDGLTVTDDEGTVKLKGGMVTADGLHVNAANIDGTLTADQINLTGSISWTDLDSSAQGEIDDAASMASTAYSRANSAYNLANSANGTVTAWTYAGTTKIDGNQLMTGTVTASVLQGGSVALINASGGAAGTITLETASSANYAVELTSNAALRITAASGYIYLQNSKSHAALDVNYSAWLTQNCLPVATDAWNCGSAGFRWAGIYSSTGTVLTSDRNHKYDIQDLPDKYLELLLLVPPKIFRLNNGTSGRIHVGYIAQDVEEVMNRLGIDSLEFAGFVKDKDENGTVIYMLRYEEFIAIHTLAVQKIYQRMEAAGI